MTQYLSTMVNLKNVKILQILVLTGIVFLLSYPIDAAVQDEIVNRNRQIEEIQKQIDQYQQQIETSRSKSRTLETEINELNAKINQLLLEIKSLGLAIGQTSLEIGDTERKIGDAETKIKKQRDALAQYIKVLYEKDQKNLTEVVLTRGSLSEFFNEINNLKAIQDNLQLTINKIKKLKDELEVKKDELEDKKSDFERLKRLEELEKKSVDQDKKKKDRILKETKGQESKFQELVKQSQKDIERIKDQIIYLRQYGVSVEDAIKFGQLAALRTGIRPAFLLAILEIESGLGRNVGTGNWLKDMYQCYLKLGKPSRAETEKNAFFAIIGKLGLDPNIVRVSREPNYGCGGALGPAQFLPSVWLNYESEISRLTNHNPPSPWNVEDAFIGAAVKLSKAGADTKTREAEVRAAKAYISGKPNCASRICNYYSSAVMRKATEIEKSL